MKTLFVVLCVIGQVAVLGFMAGEREYILRTGEVLYLRTAPVDPRDAFRGDYVALSYDVARVAGDMWQGQGEAKKVKTESKVYAALTVQPDRLAEVVALSDRAPETGPYLKGRVQWNSSGSNRGGWIQVRFGVERYYVEQGRGLEIEKRRGGRDDVQVPMEVELRVGGDGTAVIAGYRWSRIGIGLEVLRQPPPRRADKPPDPSEPLSAKLKLTLANVSDQPFALYNPGRDCAFELIPADFSQLDFTMAYRGCENAQAGIDDVFLLKPGESHDFEIDLAEPRWHVTVGNQTDEIGKLADWQRFRLVYRTPLADRLGAVPMADQLWLGRLPSRAFNAAGYVD